MERVAALKKIAKLLGKRMGYRIDPDAPTHDQREEAKSQLNGAIAERNKLRDARDARHKALLDADQEYQHFLTAWRAANKQTEKLASISHHYKFTVGTTDGMFFSIKAEGDSWEEIIAKLEEEQNASRAHIAKVQSK